MPSTPKLKVVVPQEVLNANTSDRLAKKITATVFGKPAPMRAGDADRWHFDLLGQVTGAHWITLEEHGPVKVKHGPYWLYRGMFRAISLEDGKTINAATAILPEIASDMIQASRDASINEAHGVPTNVWIAMRIGTTADGTVGREGYAWTAKLIQPVAYESPLDAYMRERYGMPQRPQLTDQSEGEAAE